MRKNLVLQTKHVALFNISHYIDPSPTISHFHAHLSNFLPNSSQFFLATYNFTKPNLSRYFPLIKRVQTLYFLQMEESKMGAKILDPSLTLQINTKHPQHGALVEEIEGLIKVYENGHVERTQIVPCVSTSLAKELNITSVDVILDKSTKIWARFYVPKCQKTLPLLVYFHGGGFCVGSAAWICYHKFLAKLAATSACAIMSVNYRLAPEHPLPAAYDDGLMALMWLKTLASNGYKSIWWPNNIIFSSIFLGGDSAGANIAHHLCIKLCSNEDIDVTPLHIKGSILIQPFFGGEIRTFSEKYVVSPPQSALSLASADTYWRLSLPAGANRDHPWCNPLKKKLHKLEKVGLFPTMVCVAELDILKDRNLEFCDGLEKANNKVKCVIYKGVGHAFQILDNSQHTQNQTSDMISHIKAFIKS